MIGQVSHWKGEHPKYHASFILLNFCTQDVHKTIGDTEDLENLDSLLDGQSHRLQLSAMIRGSGGQNYIGEQRRSGSAPAIRSLHPVGRGGGVIGTRGRGTRQSSLP